MIMLYDANRFEPPESVSGHTFLSRTDARRLTMGTAERREREKGELRQKILAAARELFATHGVEAVTMRSIAERVEYTPTTLYGYFEDKEALLHALVSDDFRQFAQRFQELVGIADPALRLLAAARVFVRFGLDHPNHYRLMFMTPLPNVPAGKLGVAKGVCAEDAYAFLQQMVQQASAANMFLPQVARDPELVGQYYFTSLHGLIAMYISMEARGSEIVPGTVDQALLTPWIDWRDLEARFKFLCQCMFASTFRPQANINVWKGWNALKDPNLKKPFAPLQKETKAVVSGFTKVAAKTRKKGALR
jgi:AcrR family transcriptional regulator